MKRAGPKGADAVALHELITLTVRMRGFDGASYLGSGDGTYVMLNGSAAEKRATARIVLADLLHWLRGRSRTDRPVLVVLDEIASLGDAYDPQLIEQLRSFNCIVVVIAHSVSGLGNTTFDQRRTLAASNTLVSFRVNDVGQTAELFGTRRVREQGIRRGGGRSTDETLRDADRPTVEPSELAQLETGECFVEHRGQVSRGLAARALPPDLIVRRVRNLAESQAHGDVDEVGDEADPPAAGPGLDPEDF